MAGTSDLIRTAISNSRPSRPKSERRTVTPIDARVWRARHQRSDGQFRKTPASQRRSARPYSPRRRRFRRAEAPRICPGYRRRLKSWRGRSGGPSGLKRKLALCSASSDSAARRAAISSMEPLPFLNLNLSRAAVKRRRAFTCHPHCGRVGERILMFKQQVIREAQIDRLLAMSGPGSARNQRGRDCVSKPLIC